MPDPDLDRFTVDELLAEVRRREGKGARGARAAAGARSATGLRARAGLAAVATPQLVDVIADRQRPSTAWTDARTSTRCTRRA
jgi:hypothetical protein